MRSAQRHMLDRARPAGSRARCRGKPRTRAANSSGSAAIEMQSSMPGQSLSTGRGRDDRCAVVESLDELAFDSRPRNAAARSRSSTGRRARALLLRDSAPGVHACITDALRCLDRPFASNHHLQPRQRGLDHGKHFPHEPAQAVFVRRMLEAGHKQHVRALLMRTGRRYGLEVEQIRRNRPDLRARRDLLDDFVLVWAQDVHCVGFQEERRFDRLPTARLRKSVGVACRGETAQFSQEVKVVRVIEDLRRTSVLPNLVEYRGAILGRETHA